MVRCNRSGPRWCVWLCAMWVASACERGGSGAGAATSAAREVERQAETVVGSDAPSATATATATATAAAAAAAAGSEDTPADAPLWLPEVAQHMQTAIAAGKLPGGVVVVGDRRGIRYQRAFGRRTITPTPEPATLDTIYDLASLTKPLATATAVGLLMERGKLTLDDRVSKHLPAFARHGKRRITIRQLLLHRAGLPAVTPRADFERPRAEAIARLLAVEPEAPPGSAFVYSDTGYLVLGVLVEKLSGMPLDAFARTNIFAPLSLSDTDFGVDSTKRKRAAPTEERDDLPIRGVVHDPRAYRLGGVAGNAGLFSTGADVAKLARMWLGGGAVDGVRLLKPETVAALTESHPLGDTIRTPGWDRRSDYSGLRGTLLSDAAFGHGGFTGTSLFIDPRQDLFVILLSNRVHPDGDGRVIELAGRIADAAARGMLPRMPALDCDIATGETLAGIDVLRAEDFGSLAGAQVALLVNDASRTRDGLRTADLLHAAPGVQLRALLSPEHGLGVDAEGRVGDARDEATGLPVYSLFGRTRRPTPRMLRDVDTLVFDLQDVGVRFFTYMSTLVQLMEVAAERGLRVVVLDRPNPLGAALVEGPLPDPDVQSFVHYHRLPIRHGMTAGELAELLNVERGIGANLQVLWMRGYRRPFLFADTGLPWRAPSPNLPTLRATLAYPMAALFESTNLSVGRGTAAPFQVIGAPFIEGAQWAQQLSPNELATLDTAPTRFLPTSARHRRRPCGGLHVDVVAPRSFRAVDAALWLARGLHAAYRKRWALSDMQRMLGHAATLRSIRGAAAPPTSDSDLKRFMEVRARFLHYTDCAATRPVAP